MAIEIMEDKFNEEVIKSLKPVLVDFWAPWCGPCKIVSPIIDEISEEYEDKLKVVKINIDRNDAIADRYGVNSIPTLKFFKGGTVVDTITGFRPKDALKKTVEKHI